MMAEKENRFLTFKKAPKHRTNKREANGVRRGSKSKTHSTKTVKSLTSSIWRA